MKRVIGIGNALTDYLVNLDSNAVLEQFSLPSGSMTLVDAPTQHAIQEFTAGQPNTLSLGGSAANTIRAMARLGAEVGYIGKVGRDATGRFYEGALTNLGIHPVMFYGEQRSGRCLSLVSPDGERTMVTFLGAAIELNESEIVPSIFSGYDCLYVEGYQVQSHAVFEHTLRTAKAEGLTIAIDLASFNVVEENYDFLHRCVEQYVDIIFANEDEARAFTGEVEPINALEAISKKVSLAVVKIGTRGALIKSGGEVIHVGIMAAARRVDTTGAGDFYAAGFLYGLCEGLTLRQCGTIGAIAAGKVIEVVGTTFGEEAWKEIFALTNRVREEKYLF